MCSGLIKKKWSNNKISDFAARSFINLEFFCFCINIKSGPNKAKIDKWSRSEIGSFVIRAFCVSKIN
jgi:hypothetical protein